MALPRFLAPQSIEHPVYHCHSRVVDRRFIFGSEEKEKFLSILRAYERLCGVRVLTYCLMDNHFHVLVEVPHRPAQPLGESALIRLVSHALGAKASRNLAERLGRWREQKNECAIAAELDRWHAQMWDLGRFMKMVKQRFSCWYNRRQPGPRTGTLWESRYRSTLVERGVALQAIATYIDLNPVRAGMVSDPLDYHWCGYAAAVAGVSEARVGLARLASLVSPALVNRSEEPNSWESGIVGWYRQTLYASGPEVRNEAGELIRRGFSEAEVDAARDAHGNLPLPIYLHHRVRYFTQGVIIGTKTFIDCVFKERREWFSQKRRSGPRRLKGLAHDCPLRCARDLTVRPFGNG